MNKKLEILNSPELQKVLKKTSRTPQEAQSRLAVFSKIDENARDILGQDYKEKIQLTPGVRTFSTGSSDYNSNGVSNYDATVVALASSFTSFLSVERAMDAMVANLPYLNLYDVKTNSILTPNIGQGHSDKLLEDSQIDVTFDLTSTTNTVDEKLKNVFSKIAVSANTATLEFVDKWVPGTFQLTINDNNNTKSVTFLETGHGDLLKKVPATLTGVEITEFKTQDAKSSVKISGINATFHLHLTAQLDPSKPSTLGANGEPGVRHISPKFEYYQMKAQPRLIIAESNVMLEANAKKACGMDVTNLLQTLTVNEYTKMINDLQVRQIVAAGSSLKPITMDFSQFNISAGFFNNYFELFRAYLTQVDTNIARKTNKGLGATAYLCGDAAATLFQASVQYNGFEANTDLAFVDGLIGFYFGVPVLRHGGVASATFYAVHKTVDGQLAPLMRGTYLPLVTTDQVFNFVNPTQSTRGIYSVDGSGLLTSDLIARVDIKFPANYNLLAS